MGLLTVFAVEEKIKGIENVSVVRTQRNRLRLMQTFNFLRHL